LTARRTGQLTRERPRLLTVRAHADSAAPLSETARGIWLVRVTLPQRPLSINFLQPSQMIGTCLTHKLRTQRTLQPIPTKPPSPPGQANRRDQGAEHGTTTPTSLTPPPLTLENLSTPPGPILRALSLMKLIIPPHRLTPTRRTLLGTQPATTPRPTRHNSPARAK